MTESSVGMILQRLRQQDEILQKLFDAQMETHAMVREHIAAEAVWQRGIEERIRGHDEWEEKSEVTRAQEEKRRMESLRAKAERPYALARQIAAGVVIAVLSSAAGYAAKNVFTRASAAPAAQR